MAAGATSVARRGGMEDLRAFGRRSCSCRSGQRSVTRRRSAVRGAVRGMSGYALWANPTYAAHGGGIEGLRAFGQRSCRSGQRSVTRRCGMARGRSGYALWANPTSAARTYRGWAAGADRAHITRLPAKRVDAKKGAGAPFACLLVAEWTGLEPATPGVTGRYSNQLNYHSALEPLNLP